MSPLTRREFMKTFGVGLASLVITSCRLSSQNPRTAKKATETPMMTCYQPTAVVYTPTPSIASLSPRNRLRVCWLNLNELAVKTYSGENYKPEAPDNDPYGTQLVADHRAALNELVAAGEIEPAVADLVQEAYAAAEYHIWRSNVPITCYEPMAMDYTPASADQLVRQTTILYDMASRSNLDPDTVAKAQKAIQHDLAFEALSQEEVDTLYKKLLADSQQNQATIPTFDQIELEISPEIEAAAKFLVELLGEN